MFRRLLDVWLPRLLFAACMGAAVMLAAAVLVAPWFEEPSSPPLLRLFAQDETVRRIALISAAGLAITAILFFRVKDPDAGRQKREPPRTMAGA